MHASGSMKEGTGVHAKQTRNCVLTESDYLDQLSCTVKLFFEALNLQAISRRLITSVFMGTFLHFKKNICFESAFWKKWVLCDHTVSVYLI